MDVNVLPVYGGLKLKETAIYFIWRSPKQEIIPESNIKELSLHDFRRAFCLACLNKGMSEIAIARIMGHTTTQLIGRYAKQTVRDLGKAYKSVIDDE